MPWSLLPVSLVEFDTLWIVQLAGTLAVSKDKGLRGSSKDPPSAKVFLSGSIAVGGDFLAARIFPMSLSISLSCNARRDPRGLDPVSPSCTSASLAAARLLRPNSDLVVCPDSACTLPLYALAATSTGFLFPPQNQPMIVVTYRFVSVQRVDWMSEWGVIRTRRMRE